MTRFIRLKTVSAHVSVTKKYDIREGKHLLLETTSQLIETSAASRIDPNDIVTLAPIDRRDENRRQNIGNEIPFGEPESGMNMYREGNRTVLTRHPVIPNAQSFLHLETYGLVNEDRIILFFKDSAEELVNRLKRFGVVLNAKAISEAPQIPTPPQLRFPDYDP